MNSSIIKGRRALFWMLATGLSMLLPKISAAPIQLYGLNYNTRQGPDWDPETKCKEDRERIEADLTMLSRMTNRLRLVSVADCDNMEDIIEICKELGMQIWIGLWVAKDPQVFEDEKAALANLLEQELITSDVVIGCTVGAEAIFREDVTVEENIEYMNEVKTMLEDAGLGDLPVSISEVAETYASHPSLTDAVDVVFANVFPFWESVPVEEAIPNMVRELSLIQIQEEAALKRIIIGGPGWPDDGELDGVQPGSVEGQITFFETFFCKMDRELNFEYYYFTGIDNAWRQIQDPNNPIEGNWGILYSDLTVKPHFEDLTFTCADGIEYDFGETDWSLPAGAASLMSQEVEEEEDEDESETTNEESNALDVNVGADADADANEDGGGIGANIDIGAEDDPSSSGSEDFSGAGGTAVSPLLLPLFASCVALLAAAVA